MRAVDVYANPNRVEAHYTRPDLATTILAAIAKAGKDPDHLNPEDLAAVDEFHIRGRDATLELARQIELDDTRHVLDVGSGLGGASRCLAREFGCRVTGLDLTEAYCRVATLLAERLGWGSRIVYRHGNALDMPFEDAVFDVVWTQHTAMNIPDKPRLYAEMWRVLKSGGVLAIYDILAGAGGPIHFPVPWAMAPCISFLVTPQEMRHLLEVTGFDILSWRDTTDAGRSWFRHVGERLRRGGTPPLGLHVLLGPDSRTMVQNLIRNLEEDRIALIETIARRR